ncbi:MAG: hypothetical protein FWD25_11285 [Clostridia bacterium]|nr:hypothetical protein [Clostridia bacterium]
MTTNPSTAAAEAILAAKRRALRAQISAEQAKLTPLENALAALTTTISNVNTKITDWNIKKRALLMDEMLRDVVVKDAFVGMAAKLVKEEVGAGLKEMDDDLVKVSRILTNAQSQRQRLQDAIAAQKRTIIRLQAELSRL